MELKRVKALSKKCLVLAACKISDKDTLYLKVDPKDLEDAIKYLKDKKMNNIRAHWTEKNEVLYIGE